MACGGDHILLAAALYRQPQTEIERSWRRLGAAIDVTLSGN